VAGLDYGYLWWTKNLDANGTRYYGKLAHGNGWQKIYIQGIKFGDSNNGRIL
jgi:hypothetical protein